MDEYDCGDQEEMEEVTLTAALSAQWNATSWYVGSVGVHSILFLLLLLLPVPSRQPQERRIVIVTDIVEQIIEEKVEDEPEIEKIVNPIQEVDPTITTDEVVINTTDIEISDTFETVDDMDDKSALGDPNNISDVDSEFVGVPALMGVGATGGNGGGGRFGTRTGGGKSGRTRQGGGGKDTQNSVTSALRWLAAHQEYDGRWDCKKYGGGNHGGDDCAVTSLALLAFLGDGNSSRFGKYRSNVKKATEWLVSQQKGGHIGPHRYVSALTTMALVESYGMSNDRKMREIAQMCTNWVVSSQNTTGAWDYSPKSKRSDTSVSGWWIMAMKSAKTVGLKMPPETNYKALEYIRKATTETSGRTSYSSTGDAIKQGGGSNRMSAVALTCLQFLGQPKNDKQVVGCAKTTLKYLPEPDKFDFYLWYYEALGFFQMGVKSPYWKTFNPKMKESLLSTQVNVGTYEENKGSWNPDTDKYGPSWGRVGQTALGALMLEIYYRYEEVKR